MNRKLLIALGCASLLVCGCGKAEEEKDPVNNQVDEQLYSIVTGDKYEVYSHMKLDGRPEYQNENIVVDFSYPELNYDSEDAKEINASIKDAYIQAETKIKELGTDGCVCVKKDDKYYCGEEHLETPEYQVYETEKALSIFLKIVGRTYCAGGYSNDTFYTISKETQKRLNKDEIIAMYNFNNSSLESSIKNEYLKTNGIELNSLDYVKYGIYDNNRIIVVIENSNDIGLYLYDGSTLTLMQNS